MMDAVRTSETSVDNYFTRQYIPEDKSELHTRRRENLKSHRLTLSPLRQKDCDTVSIGYWLDCRPVPDALIKGRILASLLGIASPNAEKVARHFAYVSVTAHSY
jgi:hypothetical protein